MKFLNPNNILLRKTTLAMGILLAFGSGSALAETFSAADTDGSGKITKDEYYGYVGDLGVYGDWDLNDDDLLEESEWGELDYDYDFASWDLDGDGYLTDDELYDGTYYYYDVDDNDYWDNDEWDDAWDAGWFDV